MNDKIISAIVSACGPIVAAIIAGAFSQDTKQTLLIFFCSIVVVLVGLLVYFSYKKNKKCSKLKEKNDELKIKNDELKIKNDELKNKNDELKEQQEEYNATISEVEKYLDNSHVTNSSIIKSTIKEHYYLSKPPVVFFDNILCNVNIIKNNESDLYDTEFEWKYEGHREPAGTDFLVDVFSTTKIDNDFEESLSIRCYNNGSWSSLEKEKEYDVTNKKDDNHRTIKFDMSKITANNFKILINYTLKNNYNFNLLQETFVFMPFIYSNARNNKFTCKINLGKFYYNVEKAVIIKSSMDEDLHYTKDKDGNRIFEFNSDYTSAKDFKNVTLNIIHINKP